MKLSGKLKIGLGALKETSMHYLIRDSKADAVLVEGEEHFLLSSSGEVLFY